jgi:hypothetical protein
VIVFNWYNMPRPPAAAPRNDERRIDLSRGVRLSSFAYLTSAYLPSCVAACALKLQRRRRTERKKEGKEDLANAPDT